MPSLSPRENYLRALRHEETEYVPCGLGMDTAIVGILHPVNLGQGSTNYMDGFGVRWAMSEAAIGGLIPAPGKFILKDVTQWKKSISIPDVDKYDWEQFAGMEYGSKFCLEGGYDITGKPGHPEATIEEVKAEVERCFRDYGGEKGYIFLYFLLQSANSNFAEKTAAVIETANRIRFAGIN